MKPNSAHPLVQPFLVSAFEEDLEAAFQSSLDGQRRQSARIGAALAITLFLAFGLLDVLAIPGALKEVLAIRFLLVVPLLGFVFWTTGKPFFTTHYRGLMIAMYAGMGLAIQGMILLARHDEVASFAYYAGLILVVIALYNWTYLRARDAALIGFGLVALYAGLDFADQLFNASRRSPFPHGTVLLANVFFFASANVIGLVAVLMRERHLREVFMLRREAEALARVKSTFLANMSHEIRTPLNGILGMAQIGRREEAEPAKAREHFDRIHSSARLLLTVVNDILDFSKIEAGRVEIETVSYSPAALAREVIELVRATAGEKGLRLGCQAEGLPAACAGDPLRISQVLLNLLSNAIKFTAQGEVRLEARVEGDALAFAVCDTGMGISDEDLERLFRPFEQLDSSITRRFGGTGLGLVISRRLARLMDGGIDVTSRKGVGSRFELRLPLRISEVPAAAPGVQSAAGARLVGRRILVAEDIEVNQLVLQDMLVREGADVELVSSGSGVLEALARPGARFDVVLMDVQMPQMDGLEATRRLKLTHPDLPVIGQTAHALREEHDKCIAAGMQATVTKPLDTEILVAAILCHLAGDDANSGLPDCVTPAEAAPCAGPIDWQGLGQRYANRPAMIDRLVAVALKSHGLAAQELRQLMRAGDLPGLGNKAHELKGVAGNFRAGELEAVAYRVMTLAREADPAAWEDANALLAELERVLAELRRRGKLPDGTGARPVPAAKASAFDAGSLRPLAG